MDVTTGVVAAAIALFLGFALGRRRGGRTRVVWQSPPPALPRDAEVEELIRRGRKIQAIRRYRELHGVELKVAKDAVDRLEATLRSGGARRRGPER